MSKITNDDGLTPSGTGCYSCTHTATVGVKGLKDHKDVNCSLKTALHNSIKLACLVCLTAQRLRDTLEDLKKRYAQLKASCDIFNGEFQQLAVDNQVLSTAVTGLKQKAADIQNEIQYVRQQV